MKSKKILILTFIAAFALVLCACGGGQDDKSDGQTTDKNTVTTDIPQTGENDESDAAAVTEEEKNPEPSEDTESPTPTSGAGIDFMTGSHVNENGESVPGWPYTHNGHSLGIPLATLGYENQQAINLAAVDDLTTLWRLPFYAEYTDFVEITHFDGPATARALHLISGGKAAENPSIVRVYVKNDENENWTLLRAFNCGFGDKDEQEEKTYDLTASSLYGPYQFYRVEFDGPEGGPDPEYLSLTALYFDFE